MSPGRATTTAQLVRVLLPEPVAPGPDRLIGHVHTTFEHQLLHVAEAQREPVIQPDAMADDLGRKPEPFIRRACSGHDRRSCPTSPSRLTNLTVPVADALPDNWTMHTLRHRFATRAYRGTRNLRAVQVLLGHESIATTERCCAADNSEIRAAMVAAQ